MTQAAAAIERVRPDPRPPVTPAQAAALQEAWASLMAALRGERRPADAATIDGAESLQTGRRP